VKGLLETFRARAAAAGGRVGAIVLDPEGRAILEMRADEEFPAASVIKLPLVMTLFAEAAAGRLSLEERLAVGERVTGSGVLSHLADVESMSLRDLAALAVTVSDNTAANRLIELLRPERVNERLDEWGCPATRLRRAMFDLRRKRAAWRT
jgi:beta-lactamase class A